MEGMTLPPSFVGPPGSEAVPLRGEMTAAEPLWGARPLVVSEETQPPAYHKFICSPFDDGIPVKWVSCVTLCVLCCTFQTFIFSNLITQHGRWSKPLGSGSL